jgi:archaellum component FlaD/FlaE
MNHPTRPAQRHEALRNALQVSVDLLHRRRASEIPEGFIDDYVSLNWLEWRGGSLRLTPLGQEICLEGLEQD